MRVAVGSDPRGRWVVSSVPGLLHAADPLVVVGHLGVDAQLVRAAAALAPGHQAHQEPGVPVQGDHRTAAVALAGVRALPEDAGAQHVVGDVVGHLAGAEVALHQRHPDDVQRRAEGGVVHVLLAPAGHHGDGAVQVQHPLGHVAARQAGGHHVLREGGGRLQAQQGDVVVHGPAVVLRVPERLRHLQGHLGAFVPVPLVVA